MLGEKLNFLVVCGILLNFMYVYGVIEIIIMIDWNYFLFIFVNGFKWFKLKWLLKKEFINISVIIRIIVI